MRAVSCIVGKMLVLAEKLAQEGESYKASDTLLKLAKIKGRLGYEPDSLQKLFSTLSQSDIDRIKQRLQKQTEIEGQSRAAKPSSTEKDSGAIAG